MKYGEVWKNQSKSRLLELAGVDENQINEKQESGPQDVQASIERLGQLFENGSYDEAKAYAQEIAKNIDLLKG